MTGADDSADPRLDFDGDEWIDRLREADSAPPLGRLGQYDLLQEVSRGGQGVVYRALDRTTQRSVALKRMLGGVLASPQARFRFEREIEAGAALDHPGIVTVYGTEDVGGEYVLTMEWIEGTPIDEWAAAAEPTRSIPEKLRVFEQVVAAVRHAHQRGVLHRDLKPSNVLVDAAGRARVVDFGLAKRHEPGDVALTWSGEFVGTPAFASPEQIGGRSVDVRSDLYSLGVLFYQMLTGRMPYAVDATLADTFEAIRNTDPVPPRTHAPRLDRDLEAIVLRLLEKSPDARYQSADSLLDDLRRYRDGDPVEAQGRSVPYVVGKLLRRYRMPVALSAAFVLLSIAFGATMTVLFQRADREAEKARAVQQLLESTLIPPGRGTSALDYRLVDILEDAAQRIGTELGGQPEVATRLWDRLARIYAQLWMWNEAERPAREALAGRAAAGGPADDDLARLHLMLGMSLAFAGDVECVEHLERSLEIRRELYGEDHIQVAAAHGTLGFGRWRGPDPPDYAGAEASYRRALEIQTRLNAPPSVESAGIRFGFAALLTDRQRFEEAAHHFADALERYRALPDELDLHLVRCLQDYGYVLHRLGRLAEAEDTLREVVALRARGRPDALLALTWWRLGLVREARGAPVEASECWARSFALNCEVAARRTPAHARRLRELAERAETRGLVPELCTEAARLLGPTAPDDGFLPDLDSYLGKLGGLAAAR